MYDILIVMLRVFEILVFAAIVVEIFKSEQVLRSNQRLSEATEKLMQKVTELERKELLMMLAETAMHAKESIEHLTYTFHTPEEEEEMGPLLEAIAKKKDEGEMSPENIRFLGPPHDNKAERLYCRQRAGAMVRISRLISFYDTRFQVVDGKKIVLTVGDPEKESRHGYLIESEYLAHILVSHFNDLWVDAKDYESYMVELVHETIQETNKKEGFTPSIQLLAERLGLHIEETDRIFKLAQGIKSGDTSEDPKAKHTDLSPNNRMEGDK
ncbi:MAG: hypothetical protein GTO45_15885 [Candidatus Aminicenantes bacterium]|nr:hypothetical protein [Candidatus Aminicenantes bacterium]NIM80256.1 hypothetical protein [Candidatus Aminicenantes bacterium]NIN19603.1 hypothetical protein [Candidatus Aminicenantes bacterium]NIN43487.1 hypothetical protein [Candidatus Aminicenantes bacterium]NIN86232.1 hypothetical protein [Candidatus Aminicenantes bacterium]